MLDFYPLSAADKKLRPRGLGAGYNGQHELTDYLDNHPIPVKCVVSSGNKRVIVQDDQGALWQQQEGEGQLKQLQSSHDGLVLQCATEKLLMALIGIL